jgi:hypothetical protein
MIKIVEGIQLIEDVFKYDVVLYGMGINNSMNRGLSYDIALNFPEVRENENTTGYGDLRKYGRTHETKVRGKVSFCACYCCNIGLKMRNKGAYIDYDALESCLLTIRKRLGKKRIASPIIGQDECDGNGDRNRILEIYNRVFDDGCDVTLYDFKQQDFRLERYKEAVRLRKERDEGTITKEEFRELKRQNEWKRLHGIHTPITDEFKYRCRNKGLNKIIIKKD